MKSEYKVLSQVPWNEVQISNTMMCIVTYDYPILIFDVDLSSFLNKTFHSGVMAFFSCNVQRSLLIERKFCISQCD